MNKRLFVLICSIILFQYIYSDTACDATFEEGVTPTQELCNGRVGSDSEICVLNTGGTECTLKEKGSVPCGEVKAGEGENNDLCLSLRTNVNKLCLKKSGGGCEEKAKGEITCSTISSGADDAICNGLQTSNNQLCINVNGACQGKAKEEVDCEKVVSGASDDLCKSLNIEQAEKETYLCIKEDDACKKKKKCKKGEGNDDTTCEKFAVETAGYVCKSDPDAKGKCKEVKKETATSSSYSLKFSLALLIFLFLF
jgi:hypothetical protein